MNILTLNLHFSGKNSLNIDIDIYNLLKEHDVDIAGFQEINGITYNKIKNILGNEYDSIYKAGPGGYCIFSKYKIVKNLSRKEHFGNNIVIDYNGEEINVINVHLHEHYEGKIPFGPYLKKKYLIDDVFNIINETQLKHIKKLCGQYNKTILMGDFNNPSHLDDNQIIWPVSKYLWDNGYIDSFKFCNSSIGLVSSLFKSNTNYRSDMIYCKGLDVLTSNFIDSNNYFVWFSDHKGLLSKIKI